mgnify:CR=1 FL=1
MQAFLSLIETFIGLKGPNELPHVHVTVTYFRHARPQSGTGNREAVLTSKTGNRRFGLIHIVEGNLLTINQGIKHIVCLIDRRDKLREHDEFAARSRDEMITVGFTSTVCVVSDFGLL